MQRIPRWQSVAATQIEVWAFLQQTLPWLDSRERSSAHPGRGCYFGGAVGILRGWFGSHGHGAHHTQKSNGWLRRQRCWRTGEESESSPTAKTSRRSVSTSGGRSCGRRMGSMIKWRQSSLLRLVVFALTRQTDLRVPSSVQHGPSETSALCVQWVAMGLPAPKVRQSPTTFGTRCWRHWCISA